MNVDMLLQLGIVDSFGVVDTAIDLRHSYQPGTFFNKAFACPISHISKALHYQCLIFEAYWYFKSLCYQRVVEELFGADEYSEPSCFDPAADAEKVERFARGDCVCIDVLESVVSLIGRFHPTHLTLSGTHIRPRDVDCRSNRIFLCQLDGILSSEGLDLSS